MRRKNTCIAANCTPLARVQPHAFKKKCLGFRPRFVDGAALFRSRVFTYTCGYVNEFRFGFGASYRGDPRRVFSGRKWKVLIFLARHQQYGGNGNCRRWLLNLLAFASRRGKRIQSRASSWPNLFGGISPLRRGKDLIIKTILGKEEKRKIEIEIENFNACGKLNIFVSYFLYILVIRKRRRVERKQNL